MARRRGAHRLGWLAALVVAAPGLAADAPARDPLARQIDRLIWEVQTSPRRALPQVVEWLRSDPAIEGTPGADVRGALIDLFWRINSDTEDFARTEVLLALVDAAPELATWPSEPGREILHLAASADRVEVVEACLAAGAGIDARDQEGRTPLLRAVETGATAASLVLIRRGADAGATDDRGFSAIHYWAQLPESDHTLLRALLDAGVPIDGTSMHRNGGVTPAHVAAFTPFASSSNLRALLAEGAAPGARTVSGMTVADAFLAPLDARQAGDLDAWWFHGQQVAPRGNVGRIIAESALRRGAPEWVLEAVKDGRLDARLFGPAAATGLEAVAARLGSGADRLHEAHRAQVVAGFAQLADVCPPLLGLLRSLQIGDDDAKAAGAEMILAQRPSVRSRMLN